MPIHPFEVNGITSCKITIVWGWGARCLQRGTWEAMWDDEVNQSHMNQTEWKSGTPLCVRLKRAAQLSALTPVSHSWALKDLHSWLVWCFGDFFSLSSVDIPFRVTAPRDMPICCEVITVATYESVIFTQFKETFSFLTFSNHLMQIK